MKDTARKIINISEVRKKDKVEASGFEFSISKLKKINTDKDQDECLVWGCSNSRQEGNLVCRECYNLPGAGRLLIEAVREAAEKIGVKIADAKKRWLDKVEWQELVEVAVRKRTELKSTDQEVAQVLGNDFPDYSYTLLISAVRAGAIKVSNDTFRKIVNAGKGWLNENSVASKEDLTKKILFLFQDQNKVVLAKAATLAFNTFHRDKKERQEAIAAARIWLDEHPNSFKRSSVEIADRIMDELKPRTGYSRIIEAVSNVIQENKDKIWIRCELAAKKHFSINPNDARHPGEIAIELLEECDLPKSMLTAALVQAQEPILGKERLRLIALANNQHKKKPGSSFRRGQDRGPKGLGNGRGKKRGVKG